MIPLLRRKMFKASKKSKIISFKKVEGATHQKDRSVFDSHEDFGDKLGLGGVKTTEVATYQTCN